MGLTDKSVEYLFAALSQELRLVILDILEREGQSENFGADPLSAAALADRVETDAPDIEFDVDNLDYHLQVLQDAKFVTYEGGYKITQSGIRIIRAIRAGEISSDDTFEQVPVEEPCPYCGGQATISLENEWIWVTCLDCPGAFAQDDTLPDGLLAGFQVTPASIQNRTPREQFQMAYRVGLQVHRLFAAGVCPECNGTTSTTTLEICPDHELDDEWICENCGRTTDEFLLTECDICGRKLRTFPAIIVATDPQVIAALYDRGYDLTDQTWAALLSPPEWPTKYVSRDPTIIEYQIPVPNEEPLVVRIDEELTVTVQEHSSTVWEPPE